MSEKLTLAQALKNVIEAEFKACEFYERLAANTSDPVARKVLRELVEEEAAHAAELEDLAQRLVDGPLPEIAEERTGDIEIQPHWAEVTEIRPEDALRLAIESENHAALMYSALADSVTGELAEFFELLSEKELSHASRLRALLPRKGKPETP